MKPLVIFHPLPLPPATYMLQQGVLQGAAVLCGGGKLRGDDGLPLHGRRLRGCCWSRECQRLDLRGEERLRHAKGGDRSWRRGGWRRRVGAIGGAGVLGGRALESRSGSSGPRTGLGLASWLRQTPAAPLLQPALGLCSQRAGPPAHGRATSGRRTNVAVRARHGGQGAGALAGLKGIPARGARRRHG